MINIYFGVAFDNINNEKINDRMPGCGLSFKMCVYVIDVCLFSLKRAVSKLL